MPPKEKPQPTESQIALLHWWISNKADLTKKVKELDQPEKIKPVLLALQNPLKLKKVTPDLPTSLVEKADDQVIAQLKERGFVILPVAQNTNYLSATVTDVPSVGLNDMQLIAQLSKQLIFLKITNTSIKEDASVLLGKLVNLSRLNLAYTDIDDKTLASLSSLKNLKQLNLVGTKVTTRGMVTLQEIKGLKSLFIYKTGVKTTDYNKLKSLFANTEIDTGNYVVPFLESDTMLVKAPVTK